MQFKYQFMHENFQYWCIKLRTIFLTPHEGLICLRHKWTVKMFIIFLIVRHVDGLLSRVRNAWRSNVSPVKLLIQRSVYLYSGTCIIFMPESRRQRSDQSSVCGVSRCAESIKSCRVLSPLHWVPTRQQRHCNRQLCQHLSLACTNLRVVKPDPILASASITGSYLFRLSVSAHTCSPYIFVLGIKTFCIFIFYLFFNSDRVKKLLNFGFAKWHQRDVWSRRVWAMITFPNCVDFFFF